MVIPRCRGKSELSLIFIDQSLFQEEVNRTGEAFFLTKVSFKVKSKKKQNRGKSDVTLDEGDEDEVKIVSAKIWKICALDNSE